MDRLTNLIVGLLILGSPWIIRTVVLSRRRSASSRQRFRLASNLPIDRAREEAHRVLGGQSPFVFAPISAGWLARLEDKVPPGVLDIWSHFGAPLYWAQPFARIAPHVLEPADERARGILARHRAGQNLYRVGYWSQYGLVYASPDEETLYEVWREPDVPDEFARVRQYPSMYHWVLSLAPPPGELLLRPADATGPSSLVRATRNDESDPDHLLRPADDHE